MRGEHELEQLHERDKAVVIPIYHRKHAHTVTEEICSGITALTRSPLQQVEVYSVAPQRRFYHRCPNHDRGKFDI